MKNYMCKGFAASGLSAGIKKNGKPDLGLIVSETTATVAGVFTQNLVKAAPVLLDQERVLSGKCRAVIVNSGNANCCNGDEGMMRARETTRIVGDALGISEELVLVGSTGVIGEPLPLEKIKAAVPGLVDGLGPDGLTRFAHAIMTTDTVPKLVCREGVINGKPFNIVGTVKGAGMIAPHMATMLGYILTDVQIDPGPLKHALAVSAEQSFNRITIDGDMSTNDTVLVLANGTSGAVIDDELALQYFQNLLEQVCVELAALLVKDGEGATKLVDIVVRGALTHRDALAVAKTVANSNLVKTAFFGQDANWGRIIGAVGRAGVYVDPAKIDLYFDDVMMVQNGSGCGKQVESKATDVLKKEEFRVTIDLNLGTGTASMMTCDFSIDYVKINADYRS